MKTEVKNPKRLWRRGNVLDIVIVLIVLASLFSIGFRYYQTNVAPGDEEFKTVRITLEAQSVRPGAVNALTQGNTVYLEGSGERLGVLLTHPAAQGTSPVASAPASVLMTDEQGNYVRLPMPDGTLFDLQAVIEAQGSFDADGVFLLQGRYPLTPGQALSVYTERVSLVLTVKQVALSPSK